MSGASAFGVAAGSGVTVAWARGGGGSSSSPPDEPSRIAATIAIATAIARNVSRCARDTAEDASGCARPRQATIQPVLVRRDSLVIGQPAHAWVSGQLARRWGNAAFPPPAPREPVCLAAEQHDVGWAHADLAPPLGDDGRPLAFVAIPRPMHVAIWRDAPRRLLAQSRYAALLVSLHGTSLYERIDPGAYPADVAAAIRAYLDDERALQASLSAGLDPAEIDRNRRLLLALDRFSLALCHGHAAALAELEVPIAIAPGDGAWTVAPWPFAAARVVVGCEAR